ncbi:NAD-glutamate dehydrogenase [Ornithinimicrobium sp. INDO-MA30-4]|nr:NAD-glutamate dehydrogenase domain-containing protein [Ornithinimicrobium sp. INDO-MA30-4]UJH71597.1 NAD-glutamate dehydrogenase [Ornithinimicrobium sp. INDO-MA30-4]
MVARGGLRWSDRREDFRTEVLGLVKAQLVKNAVIVPTGSKGGFVAKQLPDPSDRDAWMAEGISSYQTFIGSLLDITDNRVGGDIVPPERVVRHDADDPTLSLQRTRERPSSPTLPTASHGTTASGSTTPSLAVARPAMTTRAWASPHAAHGSR